ncbi:hypothetical protein LBMAG53_16390 [Planctomycetota bacterium]|nr:hypothetical protein LBMAG53_16390 [Planctomycetota bacterium]
MDPLLSALAPGRPVTLHLSGGGQLSGMVLKHGDGWLHLLGEHGEILARIDQVAAVILAAPAPPPASELDAAMPRPVSKDAPRRVGGEAPGRLWNDGELRELADAFLDGVGDAVCAERFHRTRHQITVLRQAHEVLRGNLRDDQIGAVAQGWIPRLRRALGGER